MNARPPAELAPHIFFTKPFDGKKLLSALSIALLELS